MGSGGAGGYYGGLLARQGHDVAFVARGAHLTAIQKNGLRVKSVHGDFSIRPAIVTDIPSELPIPDLVLFCTKTYDTVEASQIIRPNIGSDTTILSLQNGIDAVERIGKIVGFNHMIAGATWISSALEAPGIVKQVSEFRRIVIGEPNGTITARVRAVFELFKQTGITIELTDNILKVLWAKFLFISAASSLGSITRLPVADYRAVPETRELIILLMREVESLARRQNVALEPDIVERSLAFMDNSGPQIRASMQLDVVAGRPTEIDSILGVIGRQGRELGVPTPVADMLYALLLPVDLLARQNLSANHQDPTSIPS